MAWSWRAYRLRSELRDLRANAGLASREVQQQTGVIPSKLSRLESGQTRLREANIRSLCAAYSAERVADRLVALNSAVQWWHSWVDPKRDAELIPYLEGETDAERIDVYSPGLLPPVVQTHSYARAILSAFVVPRFTKEDVQRRLDLLTARRAQVENGSLSLWLVLSESVLWQLVGDQTTLADQLRYLTSLPSVTVQLVPMTAGVPRGLGRHFHLLRFTDQTRGLYQPTATGGVYSHESDELGEAETVITHVQAVAKSPRDSQCQLLERAEQLLA